MTGRTVAAHREGRGARRRTGASVDQDGDPPHPHGGDEVFRGRCARPGRARPAAPSSGGFSSATPSSGMKSTATNHEASSAMLTTAKIENVYSPAALARKPDRHEARHRHERAGQHRKRQRLVGERRGLFLCIALRQPRGHGIDRAHGVVDQQGQRDDQRAERNALQIDADELHDRKHDRERQRNRKRDDRRRPARRG